jgi:hypothetical protein
MTRTITFPRKRRRVLITAAGRALPGMFVLTLVVPTLIFARLGPEPMTLPAGTTFLVTTATEVSSKMPVGTRFEARLKSDLHIPGHFVTPAGTAVYGVVTRSEGGKQFGKQELAITLNELQYKGQLVPFVSDTAGLVAKPGGGLLKIGGGRIVGTMIAGAPGAIVGGLAGGASSRTGRHISIPAGKELEVHLRMPVHLP